jgi:hypothetical protein
LYAARTPSNFDVGRSSFLKRRNKKLLFAVAVLSGSVNPGMKSLLALLFRKELLCLP